MNMTGLSDIDVVLHPTLCIAKIREENSLKYQKNLVGVVKSVFSYHPTVRATNPEVFKQWDDFDKELAIPVNLRMEWNVPTDAQRAAYLPWKDVLARRDLQDVDSAAYFIMCMYSLIAPARADWGNVRILHEEPISAFDKAHGNYLLIRPTHMILTLNEFKTKSDKNPQYNKLLPLPLMEVIKRSLLKKPRAFLVVSPRTGQPYINEDSYTTYVDRLISRVTGKKGLGISMMRHIFINALDFNDLPCAALKQISRDMMHSSAMQLYYRLKF